MFCNKCGKEVDDEAVVCIGCGCSLKTETSSPQSSEGPGCFLSVLSFLIPLLGLILYLVWKDSRPVASKACGKAALWGFIVGIIVGFIFPLIFATAFLGNGYY